MADDPQNTPDLNAALAKAQGMMKAAAMDRVNPHFKSRYATLNSIWDAIRQPLSANGLAVTQTTDFSGNGDFVLVTTLRHVSGQWISSVRPLPIGKPQEMGSAETYAKRYALSSLVGITAEEDDDGNATSKGNGKAQSDPVITDEQADTIRNLITATKTNAAVFLQWANAPSVSDIKAGAYDNIIAKLQQKKATMS